MLFEVGNTLLLPLRNFELEAVVKSAVLFEEFNIHILLPAMDNFASYPQTGAVDKQSWAVYDQGKLVYAAVDNLALVTAGATLNGAFYMDQTAEGFNPILFTVASNACSTITVFIVSIKDAFGVSATKYTFKYCSNPFHSTCLILLS